MAPRRRRREEAEEENEGSATPAQQWDPNPVGTWREEVDRPTNFDQLTSQMLEILLTEAGFSARAGLPPVFPCPRAVRTSRLAFAVSKGLFALSSVVALTCAVLLRTGVPSQLRSRSTRSGPHGSHACQVVLMPRSSYPTRVLLYMYNCRYSDVPAVRNLMRNVMRMPARPELQPPAVGAMPAQAQPQLQPPAVGATPVQPQPQLQPPAIGARPAQEQPQQQPPAIGARPKSEPHS